MAWRPSCVLIARLGENLAGAMAGWRHYGPDCYRTVSQKGPENSPGKWRRQEVPDAQSAEKNLLCNSRGSYFRKM